MSDPLDLEIADTEAALHIAQKALNEARLRLDDLLRRRIERDYGVKEGSVITARKGLRGVVTHVDVRDCGKPWVHFKPYNKDGTLHARSRPAFSQWELVI